jgi:SAM-dependent methyltransferase
MKHKLGRRSLELAYNDRYKGTLGLYFEVLEGKFIPKEGLGSILLDLGAGTGRLIPFYSGRNVALIEMDINLNRLFLAKQKASSNNKICVLCGDGTSLPLKENAISSVICLGTFEYVTDMTPFLREIHRVCVDKANLVFTVYNIDRWLGKLFLNQVEKGSVEYNLSQIKRMLSECGFRFMENHSLLLMPRWMFWNIYKYLIVRILRDIWVMSCISIELLLSKLHLLSDKGQELMIRAEVIKNRNLAQ